MAEVGQEEPAGLNLSSLFASLSLMCPTNQKRRMLGKLIPFDCSPKEEVLKPSWRKRSASDTWRLTQGKGGDPGLVS